MSPAKAILHRGFLVILFAFVLGPTDRTQSQDTDCPTIARRLPPEGIEIPTDQARNWKLRLRRLQQTLPRVAEEYRADVGVLLKACEYAIDHRELYKPTDGKKVNRLIELAQNRIRESQSAPPGWTATSGRQVRGFRSEVDGSFQPLGLVFGDGVDQSIHADQQVPLYVWLHGRGDKNTDLHFICDRLDKSGQVTPEGAIVLHPFGRQCVGYKSAGETDVMEAIDFVCEHYPVDRSRIVLMGFSMGGAGVWHLAAHYGERFVAASPGAGFAETAKYQRLKPADFPEDYEQVLWRVYDVPGYVRNLFNLPFVAYSGENDKQIQAARVMEQAFASEGRELTHLIGPGMGHKYHPETLKEILRQMDQAVQVGQPESVDQFSIQSPHWRYGSRAWITMDGQMEPYADTRVDARREGQVWRLSTQNVSRLILDGEQLSSALRAKTVDIDGQSLEVTPDREWLLQRQADTWQQVDRFEELRKRPGLSGPIDDAFIDPFLVVLPSGKASNSKIQSWVRCEAEFFKQRWRALMRGDLRIKLDRDVTKQDLEQFHIVLWGTPDSNQLLAKMLKDLPIQWDATAVTVDSAQYPAENHVPVMVYPNPLNREKYVVINSGLTFRPAHDRTNSLQNPHLPDWAVISIDRPANAETPGEIVKAGFFDDSWQYGPMPQLR